MYILQLTGHKDDMAKDRVNSLRILMVCELAHLWVSRVYYTSSEPARRIDS